MGWSPIITSQFGKKVALTPNAIANALTRDSLNGISFVHAHHPIMVIIFKDESGYHVSECGNSVNPAKTGPYKGAPVELYSVLHKNKGDAIAEFISLVKSPLKFAEQRALKSCTIVPPKTKK